MNEKSKLIMGAAALILVLVFLFPIWRINLNAPQYPEGIGLNIWINKITGVNQHDLKNINGLNHYIGMKPITPESISELRIMPYVIIFFMLLGVFTAVIGSRKLISVWISLIIISGAAGLYDFYLWAYDYGHNLNPNAPIKVPGMTYQPPLIGSKQLLNITAVSLPYIGSLIILLSVLLALAALILSWRKNHEKIS